VIREQGRQAQQRRCEDSWSLHGRRRGNEL
jgi:hypothetical protein